MTVGEGEGDFALFFVKMTQFGVFFLTFCVAYCILFLSDFRNVKFQFYLNEVQNYVSLQEKREIAFGVCTGIGDYAVLRAVAVVEHYR